MTTKNKKQLIGILMCLPAIAMTVYILCNLSFLLIVILTAFSALMSTYGIKLIKDQDIREEIKEDIDKIIN